MAWLDLFESAGLPDIRGWTRIERARTDGRTRHCDRAWVQPAGARRLAFTDDLRFDYGGTWFAQWPAHARVRVGAYDLVSPPKRRASVRMNRDEVIAERPGNLLVEAIAEAEGKPQECSDTERPIVASVARASWVRALGHRDLAHSMVEAWPSEWTEDGLRAALAQTLIETSDSALRQSAPRSLVRPWLSWAAAQGRGPAAAGAKRALELLGDDTPPLPAAAAADALVTALADDQLYPDRAWWPRPRREALGWRSDEIPRSPALELLRMGWPALPALIERAPADRLMRDGLRVTDDGVVHIALASDLRREIIGGIAERRFDDDAAIAAWWAIARERGELETMVDNLAHDHANVRGSVARLVALDPQHAAARLSSAWDRLSESQKASVVTALVETLWGDPDEPAAVHSLPGLDRFVRRAFASRTFAVAAPAAEASRRLGHRGWMHRATQLAAARLAAISDDDDPALEGLCHTVSLVDPTRLVTVLVEAHASERAATREAAAALWWRFCGPDDSANDLLPEVMPRRCEPRPSVPQ
jgi:hypothetical protein